jgi:asparagine synthase (glutamine-hydrolysing)
MAGIAGVSAPGQGEVVEQMLQKLAHRGRAGYEIIETKGATLGLAYSDTDVTAVEDLKKRGTARDGRGHGRLAEARAAGQQLTLTRDALGVAPLYYGYGAVEGAMCFASEVKALAAVHSSVHEMPPGVSYDGTSFQPYFDLENPAAVDDAPAAQIAGALHERLDAAVERRVGGDEVGAWLSGGLDSSAVVALAGPHVRRLHTFAAGLSGAPDLVFAREVALFVGSDHHEVSVTLADLLAVLPTVIYHLESFDALLVRSSITNYLVAGLASDYVGDVFSGEGGDELFAGYDYLKKMDPALLPAELVDITGRLHNTALQRVDRCASAHGTVAHVPFADPEVVEFALRIPPEYKLRRGTEKWILRRALDGNLPDSVLQRTKSKFWEGAGVGDLLAEYAEHHISDAEFRQERELPNGWVLGTKEELLYYRHFREHFGDLTYLEWMGRTKGAPQQIV